MSWVQTREGQKIGVVFPAVRAEKGAVTCKPFAAEICVQVLSHAGVNQTYNPAKN